MANMKKTVAPEYEEEFVMDDEDIYTSDGVELLSENEMITPEEEAFMVGYLDE